MKPEMMVCERLPHLRPCACRKRLRLLIRLLVVVLLPAALLQKALGMTWLVEADPESPEDRVGSVVLQAASGDTILIGPGLYYEHIEVPDGVSLTFLSTVGGERTILDGGRSFPGRGGSIIKCKGWGRADLYLEDLTFQNGSGTEDGIWRLGGAVNWYYAGGSVGIRDCRFVSNDLGPSEGFGGSVYVDLADVLVVEDCVFEYTFDYDNSGFVSGGAVWSWAVENTFRRCECICTIAHADEGAAFGVETGNCLIQDCRFICTSEDGAMSGIHLGGVATIEDNVFIDYGRPAVTGLVVSTYGGIPPYPLQTIRVINNTYLQLGEPRQFDWPEILFGQISGEVEMVGNTFYGPRIQFGFGGTGDVTCHNNIFWDSQVEFLTPGGGVISCNDFWPNPIEADPQDYLIENNLNVDPLFCDAEAGDLTIAIQSPCSADSAPAGCGRIGALEERCEVLPVLRTTWGRIKSQFWRK